MTLRLAVLPRLCILYRTRPLLLGLRDTILPCSRTTCPCSHQAAGGEYR